MKWVNVTDSFSEEQRYYKDTYLEIDEVLGDTIEVSIFSSEVNDYEIYVSFGILHGIIYVKKENAYSLKEEIKSVFEKEYSKNQEPSDEFINEFCEKYRVELPSDIYFDMGDLFNLF